MQEVNGKDTLEDRVNIILDELALGIQWERSSIIVAVYCSEHIKNKVQTILAKSLGKSKQVVLNYSVDRFHYDIPCELLDHPGHGQTVYFVSGLRWGGGRGYSNAYRALNMHREYLIEGNIKAIFWLTKQEAKQLARFAPDFWAFRHKVVEFLDLPSRKNSSLVKSSKRSFHERYTNNAQDFQNRIYSAEEYYDQGCMDEAILSYRKALHKYPDETAIHLRIAEIYLSMGQITSARRRLRRASKEKIDRIMFLRELDQLNQMTSLIQPAGGGLLEQTP
jgi:tetratricopeptide (TPR) repeat protein